MEEDYGHLLAIARREVFLIVSQSARSNVTDDVAQQAIIEYLGVAKRQKVNAPEAMVRVIARRRALNAMAKWTREKQQKNEARQKGRETAEGAREDEDRDGDGGAYFRALAHELARTIEGNSPSEARALEAEIWVRELFDELLSDPMDRDIAWWNLIDHEPPRVIAERIHRTAKTVSNRLAKIRQILADALGRELADRTGDE